MTGHRHVFICGLHRSGTSLLHRILSTHPDISGFHDTGAPEDEGQHLQTVYPTGRAYGGPGKFAFAPEAHLIETSPLVSDANRQKLFSEWSRHWDLSKSVLLEKSPPNIIHSRFLQALFPDSYFIFLTRHPIAVSLATQKWSRTDLPELVEHWVRAHELMLEDMGRIKNRFMLRYEDFVETPDIYLKQIAEFLSVSPITLTLPVSQELNDGYFSVWGDYSVKNPDAAKTIGKHEKFSDQFNYSFTAPYVM